jgi:hypothetical protein
MVELRAGRFFGMYDLGRKLFWACCASAPVSVLRGALTLLLTVEM